MTLYNTTLLTFNKDISVVQYFINGLLYILHTRICICFHLEFLMPEIIERFSGEALKMMESQCKLNAYHSDLLSVLAILKYFYLSMST